MNTKVTTYRTAVDAWLALIVAGPLLWIVVYGAYMLPNDANQGLIFLGTGLGSLLVIGLLCFPCRYTLTGEELFIRSGFIKRKIELKRIFTHHYR